jgi:hypothetical protein
MCEAMTPTSIDGFYAAYLTAAAGQGFALVECTRGRIVGADANGVVFDGEYTEAGGEAFRVTLDVKVPPNIGFIQGGNSGPTGDVTHQEFMLPSDFYKRDFVRLDLGRGPVNAKFVRIRETVA